MKIFFEIFIVTVNHVVVIKIEKINTIELDFSKIFNGNVNQMVEVARKFKENIEIRDRIKQ